VPRKAAAQVRTHPSLGFTRSLQGPKKLARRASQNLELEKISYFAPNKPINLGCAHQDLPHFMKS